ncbi:MAG TPA: nucleoside triphosphate pyrophosphohydrolase [Bacteroidia bacterium]|nr:nucleoside triphosphate pyrophosphohydrolase [Bacteroidia bacterium]HNT80803.1 nucleoside triphosphate pyrophosphohydrolase [Bacteroidia bacterium]
MKNETLEQISRLLDIMDELRAKCPWDKKQSIESIRHLTIEEVYELSDAILEANMDEIKKELGDLLLHIVFYSKIASETNAFSLKDVAFSICEKLIHRHPHIYGDVKVNDEKDVMRNWEQLKLKEGKKSVLEGVAPSMPGLLKAMRMQEKASASGFDWENDSQVYEKVEEELSELRAEIQQGNKERISDEFGDLLFALVNYARFIDVNPEEALERTNKKFINRFQYIEEQILTQGKIMKQLPLTELDKYWDEAKQKGL